MLLIIYLFKDKLPSNSLINKENLTEMAYQILMLSANESFTRFTKPKIVISDTHIYIASTLLPRPPAISKNEKNEKRSSK
jgi:hypothetical protein